MIDDTWTWISGSKIANQTGVYGEKGKPSTANAPGSRIGPVGWYNSSTQELWLFGGLGLHSGRTCAWPLFL